MADSDNDVPFSAVKPKNVSSGGTTNKTTCKKSKKNSKSNRTSKSRTASPFVTDSVRPLKPSVVVTLPHLPASLPALKLSSPVLDTQPTPSPKLSGSQSGRNLVSNSFGKELIGDDNGVVIFKDDRQKKGLNPQYSLATDPATVLRQEGSERLSTLVQSINQQKLSLNSQYSLATDPATVLCQESSERVSTLVQSNDQQKLSLNSQYSLATDPATVLRQESSEQNPKFFLADTPQYSLVKDLTSVQCQGQFLDPSHFATKSEAQDLILDQDQMKVLCQEYVDNEVNLLDSDSLEQYSIVDNSTRVLHREYPDSVTKVLNSDFRKPLYLIKDPISLGNEKLDKEAKIFTSKAQEPSLVEVKQSGKLVNQGSFEKSDVEKFSKDSFYVVDGVSYRNQNKRESCLLNAPSFSSGNRISNINLVLKENDIPGGHGTEVTVDHSPAKQSKIMNLKGRLAYGPNASKSVKNSVQSTNNSLNLNHIKEVRIVNSDEGPVMVEIPCLSNSASATTNNIASNKGSLSKSPSNPLPEKRKCGLVSVLDSAGNKMLIEKDLAVEYNLNFEEASLPNPDISSSPASPLPDSQSSHVNVLYEKIAMLENFIHGNRGFEDTDDQLPSTEKNETVDPKLSTMRKDNLNFLFRLNSEDVLEVSDVSEGEDDLPHSVNRRKTVKRLKFNKCITSALQSSERLLRSEKVNKTQRSSTLGPDDKASEMLYTSENYKVVYGKQNWPLPVNFTQVPLQQCSQLPQVAKDKIKPDKYPTFREPSNFVLQMKQAKHLEKGLFYVLQALSMTMTAINALSSNLGRKEDGNFLFYPDSESNLPDREHCLGLLCSSAKVACKLTAEIKANLMAISRDHFLTKTEFNQSEKRQLRSLPFDSDSLFPMENLVEMCEVKNARLEAAAQSKLLKQATAANSIQTNKTKTQSNFEPYDSRNRQGGRGKNYSFRPSSFRSFNTQSRSQRGGPFSTRRRESQVFSPSQSFHSSQASNTGRGSFRGRRRGGNHFTPGVSGFK